MAVPILPIGVIQKAALLVTSIDARTGALIPPSRCRIFVQGGGLQGQPICHRTLREKSPFLLNPFSGESGFLELQSLLVEGDISRRVYP
jgi:hypothetical protein